MSALEISTRFRLQSKYCCSQTETSCLHNSEQGQSLWMFILNISPSALRVPESVHVLWLFCDRRSPAVPRKNCLPDRPRIPFREIGSLVHSLVCDSPIMLLQNLFRASQILVLRHVTCWSMWLNASWTGLSSFYVLKRVCPLSVCLCVCVCVCVCVCGSMFVCYISSHSRTNRCPCFSSEWSCWSSFLLFVSGVLSCVFSCIPLLADY